MAASSEIDELSLLGYEDDEEVLMSLADILSEDDEISSVVPALPPRVPTLAMTGTGAPPPAVAPFPTARIATTPPTLPSSTKKTRRPRLSKKAARYLKEKSDTKVLRLVLLDDSPLHTDLRGVLSKYLRRDEVKTLQFLDEYWNSILHHLEKHCTSRLMSLREEQRKCVSDIKKNLKRLADTSTTMMVEIDSNPTAVINDTNLIRHMCMDILDTKHKHSGCGEFIRMYTRFIEQLTKNMSLTDVGLIHNGKTANEYLTQIGTIFRFEREFEDPAKKSMDDRKHFTLIDGGTLKDGIIGHFADTHYWRRIACCMTDQKTLLVRYLISLLCGFVDTLSRSGDVDAPTLGRVVIAIDRELARAIPPPTPPFNGIKTILLDVEKDDVDPITLEPFESGSEVLVMSCCRNKLCKESVIGILNSGRTPKCPMCRAPMFTAEWDRDMTWFA